MKIALIHIKRTEGNSILPPLGLLYIAAVLKNGGHEVQVIDEDPAVIDIVSSIGNFNPDIIGFSMMTPDYQITENIYKQIKQKFPNIKYCLGGVHPSALPSQTINNFGDGKIDFLIVGEGEFTMLELCNALKDNRSPKDIKGLLINEFGNILDTGRRGLISDLDTIPFPARELLDFSTYLTPPGVVRGFCLDRTTTIMTARGCPHDCLYCGNGVLFDRKVRRRSVDNVISEIEELIKDYSIRGLFFLDDTFTINKSWVKEFCRKMREKNFGIRWACQARVDTVTDEMIKDLKSAGCVQLDFGVESGSDKILQILDKRINTEIVRRAFKASKNNGLRTMATFIIGSPEETKEDIEKTLDLAKEISPNFVSFFFMTPYPGSKIYKMAIENKWIEDKAFFGEEWCFRQVDEPFMAIKFSKEELTRIRGELQNAFWFRNFITLPNLIFSGILLRTLLCHPVKTIELLLRALRFKRFDNIVEGALTLYRFDMKKTRKIKRGGLFS